VGALTTRPEQGRGGAVNYELLPWLMAAGGVVIVGALMLFGRFVSWLFRLFFGD